MTAAAKQIPEHHALAIHEAVPDDSAFLFSEAALDFIFALEQEFGARHMDILVKRDERQEQFDAGVMPDFNPATKSIREGEWTVAPVPADLLDRRVEITGPAEPKMLINALNSGAKVFMADLEDSLSPKWERVVEGQKALYDAVRKTLTYTSPEGKQYALNDQDLATLIVRPRGWHLPESNVTWDDEPISGALFDFGMYFFHNAEERVARGTGPYFYIPKQESAEEAQLWADVFAFSEGYMGLDKGTIKATVLIEVITATFEMHEILHALKDYAVGLNCGRWDYIFSVIKKFHALPEFLMPDRTQITMESHFLKSYSQLLIQTCHKRGAFAMGGMSAFIPVKNDQAANDKAFAAVRADKEREAQNGHDGTWVAHPGLIPVAMEVFDRLMPTPNQRDNLRLDVNVTAKDLLSVPQGTITEAGVRNSISVAIQYTAQWLAGNGCVPLFNLMEDAATAEISRSQLWQWVHHGAKLDNGTPITLELVAEYADAEMEKLNEALGDAAFTETPYVMAHSLIMQMTADDEYTEFLTLPAYLVMQR